jgi:hypothetical protein
MKFVYTLLYLYCKVIKLHLRLWFHCISFSNKYMLSAWSESNWNFLLCIQGWIHMCTESFWAIQ